MSDTNQHCFEDELIQWVKDHMKTKQEIIDEIVSLIGRGEFPFNFSNPHLAFRNGYDEIDWS